MVVVVVELILLDEVSHDHTGAHDHHGRTVLLKLAFLATPGRAPYWAYLGRWRYTGLRI